MRIRLTPIPFLVLTRIALTKEIKIPMNINDKYILFVQLKKSKQEFTHIINKYTKLDPTLPRVSNILCANAECSTNTENKPREIIYLRYDDTNMKYVYLCSTCDIVWKTEDKS